MDTILKQFKRFLPLPTRLQFCTHEKTFKIYFKSIRVCGCYHGYTLTHTSILSLSLSKRMSIALQNHPMKTQVFNKKPKY